jgi:serine/threonine protein kinase
VLLKPGDTLIDTYLIKAVLGRGAFGITYLAEHRSLGGALRVVKQLLSEHLGNEEAEQRFTSEAQTMARLQAQNVVIVHDLLKPGGPFKLRDHFIVMEYLAGGSLKDYLDRQGELPLEQAVRLAMDVLRGLAGAHREGIVHRDIKPGNVLLNEDATVAKVGDWGLVHLPNVALTIGGQPGTIAYMSVEQAEGQRAIDGRSDLYSVGAMLYEMVAGHPYLNFNRIMRRARAEFLEQRGLEWGQELSYRERRDLEDATHAAMFRAIIHDRMEPLSGGEAADPRVPALEAVLARALAKETDDRFQTAEAMIEALEQVFAPAPAPPAAGSVSSGGGSADALLEQAKAASKEYRFAEAVELLERARQLAPRRVRIYTQLAAAYNLLGQQADARIVLEQAMAVAPDDPSVLRSLGITYHQLGEVPKALEVMERLLRIDPSQSAIRVLVLKWRSDATPNRVGASTPRGPGGGWRPAN